MTTEELLEAETVRLLAIARYSDTPGQIASRRREAALA